MSRPLAHESTSALITELYHRQVVLWTKGCLCGQDHYGLVEGRVREAMAEAEEEEPHGA